MQDTLTMPLGTSDIITADDFVGLASSPESNVSSESYCLDIKEYLGEILDPHDLFPEIGSLLFKPEASELTSSSSISTATSASSMSDLGFAGEPLWSSDMSGRSPWRDYTDYSNAVISDVYLLNGTQMKTEPEAAAAASDMNANSLSTYDDLDSLVNPLAVMGIPYNTPHSSPVYVKPELEQPVPLPPVQQQQSLLKSSNLQENQPQPRSILGSSQSMSPPMSDDEDQQRLINRIFDDSTLDDVKINEEVLNTINQVIEDARIGLDGLDCLSSLADSDLCEYLTGANDLDDDDVFLEDEEEDDEFIEDEEEEDDDEEEEVQVENAPPVKSAVTKAPVPATATAQIPMMQRRAIKQEPCTLIKHEPCTRATYADQVWRSVRHHAALDHTYHKDINSECFMARYGLETPSDSGSAYPTAFRTNFRYPRAVGVKTLNPPISLPIKTINAPVLTLHSPIKKAKNGRKPRAPKAAAKTGPKEGKKAAAKTRKSKAASPKYQIVKLQIDNVTPTRIRKGKQDEEIDVVSVDRYTLPTNPTFYDRRNIQRRITTAIRTGTVGASAPSATVVATATPTVATGGRGRRPKTAPAMMAPITIPTQRMVAICPAVPVPVPAKQPRKYTRKRKPADDEEDYVEAPRAPKKPRQQKAKGASAATRRRARNSDNVKPDEKREMHNNLERGRRVLMRDRFDHLRRVVPQISKRERAPKVTILQQATRYCAHLREAQAELKMEANELRLQREFLTQKLKTKRSELYQFCNYLAGGDETLLRQTYEMLRLSEGAEDGDSSTWWTENGVVGAGTENADNVD